MGSKFSAIVADGSRRSISQNMKLQLGRLDWKLLKSSAIISGGMFAARILGFVFYLILAREFEPGAYGEILYSIALAEIFAIGIQPLGQHVLARFIGIKKSAIDLKIFFSNAGVVLLGMTALSLVIAIPILPYFSNQVPGVLSVGLGCSIFYVYWGISRGFLASGRLVSAYLGSNALQLLLTFLIIQFYGIKSIFLALLIYGGSYLLPLFFLQFLIPLPVHFDRQLINWGSIKPILRFSLPICLSHAAYILAITLDVLLLKQFADIDSLGKYTLAKSITAIFIFVPSGIGTVLMPRVASLPSKEHHRLLSQSLCLSLLINIGLLLGYILVGEWAIQYFFNASYISPRNIIITLSLGMIAFGIQGIISSYQVGKGRANWETISRVTSLVVITLTGCLLIPSYGNFGAALTVLFGSVSSLFTFAILELLERRRS
jgi:O-antigen/teichoic acid export membrane protein